MTKYQLEELKNIVAQLDLNNGADNLEAEACDSCCNLSDGGIKPPTKETELQKVAEQVQP